MKAKERLIGVLAAFAASVLLISTLVPVRINAQASDRADGMRFVPNVEEQFNLLTFQLADPLGFHMEGTPDPQHCKHYQGMARVDGPDGTPFFLMTLSGNSPDGFPGPPCNIIDGPAANGHLIVFRMGSRDKNGERLRSNRLRKGVHVDHTEPPAEDRATIYYSFVGGDPNDPDPNRRPGVRFRDGEGERLDRVYQHPGGMQLVGKILAVSLENRQPLPIFCEPDSDLEICNPDRVAPHPTAIMFFDVSNPEAPVFKSQFAPVHPEDGQPFQKAGVVAITPLPNGLYLMATTGGPGDEVHFFRSTVNDLSSPSLSWEFVDKTRNPIEEAEDDQQTLQFIRERDINGQLYLAAVRGHAILGADHDKVDLYTIDGETANFELDEAISQVIVRRGRVIRTFPNSGGERLANGAAASTFYVSPTGELIFYATEHDNDGPDNTVKAGEWAHIDMVRYDSPTYLPNARVGGPYEVDEGMTTVLTGSGESPITKAWIQLYNAHSFGSVDFQEFNIMVDYADYGLDDFDNFNVFETNPPFTFANTPSSWRWFAPPGCSIRVFDFGDGTQSDQPEIKTLVGDGVVHGEDSDLGVVLNDEGNSSIDNEIDAVDFLDGCDAYYSAPIFLDWDLDVSGGFETTGNAVTFGALAFDGPSEVNVPVQARHSTSGQLSPARVKVTVRNVAPNLSQFGLIDSGGNQVGTTVPFVLTNSPVILSSGFVDPGVLDHQTASISWGDGITQENGSFVSFDEAFGDGVGAFAHSHVYVSPGTYTISANVSDDDGGIGSRQISVRVVTPEQAVQEIIAMLNAAIAACPNSAACFDLGRVRVALAGSNPESVSGALKMIRAGDRPSSSAFLRTAGTWLTRASEDGATGLETLQALVTQVAAALA